MEIYFPSEVGFHSREWQNRNCVLKRVLMSCVGQCASIYLSDTPALILDVVIVSFAIFRL